MVDRMKENTGLKIALEAVGISKSSYYYKSHAGTSKSKKKYPLDARLVDTLLALSGYELTLGYRKTMDYIDFVLKQGHSNHKKVYRHMKKLGMLQPKQVKKRGKPKKDLAFYSPLKSNVRWEADLSYVLYGSGMAHAFVVIDTYDKEVIGRYFSLRARAQEALIALDQAVAARFGDGPPDNFKVYLRVDRGCQYTAEEFCEAAAQRPWLKVEYCGVQAPNDKPYIESWFASYKKEEVYRNDYSSFWEAKTGFEDYVEWYNTRRPHGSLGNISPLAFRARANTNTPTTVIELPAMGKVSHFSALILSRN